MLEWTVYLKIFTGLFAIINPVGAIPVYMGLVGEEPGALTRRNARLMSLTVFLVLSFVLFTGQTALNFFGVSLPSFKAAGGLLILIMAISMMQARQPRSKQTIEEHAEAQEKESIAIVPLAVPMLSGPGAISAVILYSGLSDVIHHKFIVLLIIMLLSVVIYILFVTGPNLARLMGKTGINIVTRIMGLFIAAVGIEFMTSSLLVLFPGLR